MKGHISIIIPTKRYVKAYILSQLGSEPVLNNTTHIGSKLYDLLQHETDPWPRPLSYDDEVKVFIPIAIFYRRGGYLNRTNLNNFNLYLERYIKDRYRFAMDVYMQIFPNFTANLPVVRKLIGISDEDWDTDVITKDYYRYRKRTGGKIYKR